MKTLNIRSVLFDEEHGDFYGAGGNGGQGGSGQPDAGNSQVATGQDDTDSDNDFSDLDGLDAGNDDSNADGDSDGGQGDDDELPDDLKAVLPQKAQKGQQQQGQQQPPQPGVLTLDAKSLAALQAAQQGQGQGQGQKQLSPEEIKKILQPVEVTKETLMSLGFTEPTDAQVKGFQELMNAGSRHAAALTRALIAQAEQRVTSTLTPIQEYYLQQQQRETENQFFETFPSLKNYKTVVQAAANKVSAHDVNGNEKSVKQIYNEVARETVQMLKGLGVKIGRSSANPSTGRNGVPQPRSEER